MEEHASASKQRLTIAGEDIIFLITKYIPIKQTITIIFPKLESSTVTIPPDTRNRRNPNTAKSIR